MLLNEIQPYLGQTSTSMPSGIVEVQNHGWSFHQICLRTVTSSNQQLHLFIQFLLIFLIIPHLTPIDIRHEMLVLGREGIGQSAIAGRMGLTPAPVTCILLPRHAATETLVPGKSTGAPRKVTPRQDRA